MARVAVGRQPLDAKKEAGMLDNYALLFPGYDEYQFDLDSIWHDPYVLTSIISALHESVWTLDEVQGKAQQSLNL